MQQIYYLQECDAWKSNDSMRLVFIGTSRQRLKSIICRKIAAGDFEYGSGEDTPREQVNQFIVDWKTKTNWEINDKLCYGIFDYAHNNEEL